MYSKLLLGLVIGSLLSGCFALRNKADEQVQCERISEINQQVKQCEQLQKQINSLKDKPLRRAPLEERYQADCVDLRFYRDQHGAEDACKTQ